MLMNNSMEDKKNTFNCKLSGTREVEVVCEENLKKIALDIENSTNYFKKEVHFQPEGLQYARKHL
jgi:hypothetical protein